MELKKRMEKLDKLASLYISGLITADEFIQRVLRLILKLDKRRKGGA